MARPKDIRYRATEKGKLTRKVGHFKERFPEANSEDIRQLITVTIGQPCIYCSLKLTLENMSADHRVSLKNGGKSDFANMDLICKECNRAKGDFNSDCFTVMLEAADNFGEKKNLLNKLRRASLVFGRRF